jgi:outer membrane protein TolC
VLAVEMEVREAFLSFENHQKVIETAQKNVELARETLRLANVRYAGGVAIPLEVSDANVQFVRARISLVNSVYDLWEAAARLQRATGSEDI